MKLNLFSHDHSQEWPSHDKFPVNESTLGFRVKDVLMRDVNNTENLLVITGFTSLSNLVETFGTTDYPKLKNTRIVIGFDIDERVSKKLVHYSLQSEIKEYWLKQGVSIKLCGPIINIIEKIKKGEINFRVKKGLHAKIYIGDHYAMLGSSNFSKSGLTRLREANIRVGKDEDEKELYQYNALRQIAENYFTLSEDYNEGLIELLSKLLKDATWEEALARAVAEVLENKWMRDFSVLYQALINKQLWPSQKIGISRAMSVIQDRGNVLLADPTGSGKTKFATTLAYTLFHWLGENGYKDRSNALIIAPKQVVENWEEEQGHFNILNKIESMGKLSNSRGKSIDKLQKEIEKIDILLIDEAHNYLNWKSKRSTRIRPKRSAHIILSTATPINKNPHDLLRLIELLDVDNLSDKDLHDFIQLRKEKKKGIKSEHIEKLKTYINQFIVRRTKKELNKMIEREPEEYKNINGHTCKYPKAIPDVYETGETEEDRNIVAQIHALLSELKGVNYLQKLNFPFYLTNEDEKKQYLVQRFRSGPALASFEIKSSLRSSQVALYEYLYGTQAARDKFGIKSSKDDTGDIIKSIKKCRNGLPKRKFPDEWLSEEHRWILNETTYQNICEKEISIYEQIGELCEKLSGKRELAKAHQMAEMVKRFGKILAFDSTVITLDYMKHLLDNTKHTAEVIIATGSNEKNKKLVKEWFSVANKDKDKKLIALCSDAMAEGINLPSAKALILLDMPSVLRIIEQRIGRLERMDSEHEEIHVFWPNDSEEFSLRGDKRVVETLLVTDSLIGNNVDIPRPIYEKHLKAGMTVQNIINAYTEFTNEDYEWQGVKDSTQNIYSLIEGKGSLIDGKTYKEFRDIEATIKSAVSFVESDKAWSFFAFRADSSRSPKWMLIDDKNVATTDFSIIAEKLKEYLGNDKVVQRKWNEVDTQGEIKRITWRLRQQERNLLPEKKKRALSVAEKLLNEIQSKHPGNELVENLLGLFKSDSVEDAIVDYDRYAELWLTVFLPALDEKRIRQKRRRNILSLKDLTVSDVRFDDKVLSYIYENCQSAATLESMIASCIIAIQK